MADIFISYKREEQPIAKKLADALQKKGWTVWWDPEVLTGERFHDIIDKELKESKCVVVLWSKLSVESENVKDEATYALKRKKLVPITIEDVDLPYWAERINTGQLINWDGSDNFPGYQKLVSDISKIIAEEDERREQEEGTKPYDPEFGRIWPPEPKPPEPSKTSNALKLAALAGVIVLLMVGILWWVSHREGRLFVETAPENAIIKILNINQGFRQGMELKPGKYHVQVSSEGYEPQDRWIDLGAGEEKKIKIELPKIGVVNRVPPEKSKTNSIDMKFVLIRAGKFVMGSPPDEPGRNDNEKQHEVIISKPFYLQTTEVSQGQWKRVMGDNPSMFKDCANDCPVERVSWDMAQEFISKLNKMEGTNKYRLPTEAEWEYACRAGTSTIFSFGDDEDKLGEYGWYKGNSESQTHPGGKKKPNAWGLYDMHGNVLEWVEDDWHDSYNGTPTDGSAWIYEPRGPRRVMRGGSWGFDAPFCRSAKRGDAPPGNRDGVNGFRVARDL